jgi:putative NIF3 family GTP cyclohydrolase 1 type 2
MQAGVVRHTALLKDTVQRVAVCGGAGSFLLKHAIAQKADVYITADFKYHEFFDAENKIVIADIGHFESEQFTIDLLQEKISVEWNELNVFMTTVRTNPVFYL